MNFFGHAVVASWHRREDGFVLGSMLPDFASMIGTRPPAAVDSVVTDGIAFHHETDRVFHDSTGFSDLEREARRQLEDEPLRRGSKLAIAHVGVELLLDLTLLDEGATRAFSSALVAGSGELGRTIQWRDGESRHRYEALVAAVRERAERGFDSSSRTIARRIERALSGRPRLCLDPTHLGRVERWVDRMAPLVATQAEPLFAEICAGLGIERHGGHPPR